HPSLHDALPISIPAPVWIEMFWTDEKRLERGSSHERSPAGNVAIDCNRALVATHETCQERPLHFLLARAKGRAKDVEKKWNVTTTPGASDAQNLRRNRVRPSRTSRNDAACTRLRSRARSVLPCII